MTNLKHSFYGIRSFMYLSGILQVVNILQNLVSQSGDSTQQQKTAELMNHPAVSSVFGGGGGSGGAQPPLQAADSYIPQQRTALLDTPKQARPTLLGEPPCYPSTAQSAAGAPPPAKDTSSVVANNLNL